MRHQGQKEALSRLSQAREQWQKPVIWFHAASLGEFEQGRPVWECILNQHPNFQLIITFFSPSGYEVRQHYSDFGAQVFYLPLDTPAQARRFLDLAQPRVAFFIRYEFWFNFLHEIQSRKIPLFLISALFRPEQWFFKPYGSWFRKILPGFSQIFVQNEASAHLLQGLGLANVQITGDTRFDRVMATAQTSEKVPLVQAFKKQGPLLVVGSCWGRDLDLLLPFLKQFTRPLKVILAPHEIEEKTLQRIEQFFPGQTCRFSLAQQETNPDFSAYNFLLVDNVGWLARIYREADIAYVGGAFGEGLHNILEPAAFGAPVLFGPQYQAFAEAVALIEAGGAFSVSSQDQLAKVFDRLYQQETLRFQIQEINRAFVRREAGGSQKIANFFFQYLNNAT